MLRSARARRMLAAVALAIAAAPAALLAVPHDAAATTPLDVYAVKASGTAVRITVQTGYSFVVEPDAMIPRAAATIEADQVNALASPLDPGDSVDALPGLGVPVAEQDIEQGAQTPFPGQIPAPPPFNLTVPSPLAGSTPPPQFSRAVDTAVGTFAAIFNPTLTAPYEHAQASYPNPNSSGPQRATFPPGSSDNVPPDFPDILGLTSAHSSSGSASAAPGRGVADAGVGSAVTIPALGLSIGRASSHVEVSGATGPAISEVVTALHDVDLRVPASPGGIALPMPLPAGTTLLHIGALTLTAITERAPGAAAATSHTSMAVSDVEVLGHSARLDQNGLSVDGVPSPLNGRIGQLIAALGSRRCTPNPPIGVPNGPSLPVSQPVLTVGPPVLEDQASHGGNERTVSMTGLTLCLAGITPVPNASAQPLSPTPTIYTITLGTAASSAYGITLPQETGLSVGGLPPSLPETGMVPGGFDTTTTTTGGTPGTPGSVGAASTGGSGGGVGALLATLTGGILNPKVVVTVATIAELVLLATLWLSYRLAAATRRHDASPTSRMDLI
jgi:hypothetical protein